MAAFLFVLLLLVPVIELWVLLQVGEVIGLLPTISLWIGVSVAGAYLLKREGLATWARLQRALREGRTPTTEVTDGALLLVGGALLLTPGFVSDAVGLVFVFPPTRAAVKGLFRKLLGGWAAKRMGPAGYAGSRVYRATVVRSRRGRTGGSTPPPSLSSPSAPSTRPRSDEDVSPGTG